MGRPLLKPDQRRGEIDALRGMALFGVLLVNLYGFGADSVAWEGGLDRFFWSLKHVVFESKFWGLFSLLFGVAFWMQTQSDDNVWRLSRRFATLLLFGLCHALLFEGDILMLYAELGFCLLALYRLPDRVLLPLALACLLVFPIAHGINPDRGGGDVTADLEEARLWLQEDREASLYVSGSFWEIVTEHAHYLPEIPWEDYQWPDSGFAVLSFFLFGYIAARRGWVWRLTSAPKKAAQIGLMLGFVGLCLMIVERYLAHRWGFSVFGPSLEDPLHRLLGDGVYLLATTLLTLAWFVLGLGTFVHYQHLTWVKYLVDLGRLSLTVYLMQSLIFTTLFYGYGLGLAYRLGPAAVTALAMTVFAVQAVLARCWLRCYAMGPAEWLWRYATDLRPPIWRRRPDPMPIP